MWSIADFKDLMAGLQSLAVSLAVVAGGIWSLFTFRVLSTKRKALAELADLEARVKRQGVVNLTTTVSQLRLTPVRQLALAIDVNVMNVGSRNVLVRFGKNAIGITECVPMRNTVTPIATRYVPYEFLLREDERPSASGLVIRAGKTWHLPFVACITRPGLYHVLVQLQLSSEEAAVAAEAGLSVATDSVVWSDSVFAVVHPIAESGELVSPVLIDAAYQTLVTSAERLLARTAELFQGNAFPEEDSELRNAIAQLADTRVALLYADSEARQTQLVRLEQYCDEMRRLLSPAVLNALPIDEMETSIRSLADT